MSSTGTSHTSGVVGKVNIQDLSLTKFVDKATPPILLKCASGAHIDQAVLVVRRPGDRPVEFIKITLFDVLVSAVSTGGSEGENRLTENVTLNFAKVRMEYIPIKEDGTVEAPVVFSWNILTNSQN